MRYVSITLWTLGPQGNEIMLKKLLLYLMYNIIKLQNQKWDKNVTPALTSFNFSHSTKYSQLSQNIVIKQ